MAYLDLQTRSTRSPYNLSEVDHEDQMPTHVIWGEVESVSRLTSHNDSATSSVSSSDLHHTSSRKKKLKNKRLDFVPQNRDLFPQHIQFRSEDSLSNLTTPEVSEEMLHKEVTSKDLAFELAEDATHGGPLSSNQKYVNPARCQRHLGGENAEGDDKDSEESDEMYTPQEQPQSNIPQSPEELEALLANVRKNARGVPMSQGSAGHDRNCKPCLFVHTKLGCANGMLCTFCHFLHRRGTKPRPCKAKRSRYNKLMSRFETSDENASHSQAVASSDLPETNPSQM